MPHQDMTRRAVVTGTGVLAVSAALAACSSYGNQNAEPAPEVSSAPGRGRSPISGLVMGASEGCNGGN